MAKLNSEAGKRRRKRVGERLVELINVPEKKFCQSAGISSSVLQDSKHKGKKFSFYEWHAIVSDIHLAEYSSMQLLDECCIDLPLDGGALAALLLRHIKKPTLDDFRRILQVVMDSETDG